jgi:hypothetical protein
MSDLAPFVVAVLKDKVTADLLQENEELQCKLRNSRKVSITGPGGTPVYAEGQFEEGRHAENPNLWEVDLHDVAGITCPLPNLINIEVRLGGVCKASFVNGDHQGFADGEFDEQERTGPVNFFFSGSGRLWLNVLVAPFASAAAYSEIASMDGDDMVSFLCENLDVANTMSAKFVLVKFVIESVSGAIDSLNLDPAILEEAERGIERRNQFLLEWQAERAAAQGNDDDDRDSGNDDNDDDDNEDDVDMEDHADEQA